jgi:hypothetical protein
VVVSMVVVTWLLRDDDDNYNNIKLTIIIILLKIMIIKINNHIRCYINFKYAHKSYTAKSDDDCGTKINNECDNIKMEG